MVTKLLMGGEGWLLEEGGSQTGWRVPSTPSPAQPACPLWLLLRTPALTHTPRVLHSFALKDLPKFPQPCLASPSRGIIVELGGVNEHELSFQQGSYMRARERENEYE